MPANLFDAEPEEGEEDYNRCEECGCDFDDCECDETSDGETCADCGLIVDECTCEGPAAMPGPAQSSLASAFDAETWERNKQARARLVSDPSIIRDALPAFMALLGEYDAAMRSNDIPSARLISDRCDLFAAELQGGDHSGMLCEDGAAKLLELAAAAPDGVEPTWGQAGNFTLELAGTKVRFEYSGIFGIGGGGFSIHAVDWHRPFFSETGFRSFCGSFFAVESVPEGWGVSDWVRRVVTDWAGSKDFKKERNHGLPMIKADYRERHTPEPEFEPAWVPAVVPVAAASQLTLF